MESQPTQDSTFQPAVRLCRAEGLWFEDGNVVLQAENVVFKLYRGILSRESTVFADMFSLPQPDARLPGFEDTYDGCQLVRMHDDEEDLEEFLRALFEFEYLNGDADSTDYAAILRLATKYQADALRSRVIKLLQYLYPSSLKAWDEIRNAGSGFPSSHPLHRFYLDDLTDHMAVVNAARETGVHILLPAAMLRIYERGVNFIVAKTGLLDDINRNTIIAAHPNLAKLSRRQSFAALYSNDLYISSECHSATHCFKVRRQLLTKLEASRLGFVIAPFTQVLFTPDSKAYELCSSCRGALKTSYEKGRASAWQALPKAFGLPSWAEMLKAAEDEDDQETAEADEEATTT